MLQGNNNIKKRKEYMICVDCYLAKMTVIQDYHICPFCTNSKEV